MSKIKLISLIIASTITIFLRDWQITTFLILFIFTLTILLRPKRSLLSRIKPLFIIGLLVILFQLIFNTSISLAQRTFLGLVTAEKIMTLSVLVFLFTSTTSPSEIVSLFSFLPAKIQLALTITFSLIPAIIEESGKIILIQNARGRNSRSLNPAKSILPIIIPLLHRTLKRAEQIAIVLQARGYDES